jgi:hypothetical protein
MDDKHPVYDVGVLGLLAFVFFWLASATINHKFAMWIFWKLITPFTHGQTGASEAVARWVGLGVILLFSGSVFQVLSILIFGRTHLRGPGREVLAKKIRDLADRSCFDVDLKKAIADSPDDALFALVHYSDPRERLIAWGRWKLRYAYLAENWIVAISGGIILGIIALGMCSLLGDDAWWAKDAGLSNSVRIAIGIVGSISASLILWRLFVLRKDNLEADLGMIAAYCAGVLCPTFKTKFIPPLQEITKITECSKCGNNQNSQVTVT